MRSARIRSSIMSQSTMFNDAVRSAAFVAAAGATAVAFGGASLILYRRFRTLPQAQAADVQNLKDLISNNKVLVLSKTYCPYCKKTKELLGSLNAKHTIIELDTREDGDRLQGVAQELTGQRTVPNVFIDGKHIGGNDKTQELHRNGQLIPLLKAAGAL